MLTRSWMLMESEPSRFALPDDLRAQDTADAVDCGWVSQMLPFVREFTNAGDRVLDPFAGFGSTLVACAHEGRRGVGIEIDPERAAIAKARVARGNWHGQSVRCGDAREMQISEPVALCLTNVPYFGAEFGTGLYETTSYQEHLYALDAVFRQAKLALVDHGRLIVMAQNLRLPSGRFVPFAWDLARVLGERFRLEEERVLCYEGERRERSHEYALIARNVREAIDADEARSVVRDIEAAGIHVLLVGSLALEQPSRPPADCDVLVSQHSLPALAEWLDAHGFGLTSWGEPVSPPLELDRLRKRYYLRARRIDPTGSALTLDVIYEADGVRFEDAWNRRETRDGIAVASGDDLEALV